MDDLNSYKQPTSELRTTARMVSILAILTGIAYVWVFVNSDTFSPSENTAYMITAVCIFLASVGLILAFRWEAWGGLFALLCGAVLIVILSQVTDSDWLKVFFFSSPFIISGIFMLLSGWRNR